MKVTLVIEAAPGYPSPFFQLDPNQPVLETLRRTYPYQSVVTSAETNGLKVVSASIGD